MIATLLLPLVLSAPAPLPPISAPPAVRQDDDEKPDKRDEIKALLEELKGYIGKRGDQDVEAIGVIDKLYQEFPESGKKDRAAIVKGLSKCFDVKRQESDDGVPDNKLYMASAISLGDMSPESVKVIAGWIGHKRHRKDIGLQRRLVLSLGKTEHEDGIDTLTDLLRNKDYTLQGAAAEALGMYKSHEQKVRKEIFSDVLKVMMAAYGDVVADTSGNDPIVRERWDIVQGPMTTSLQQLSGHDARKPEVWQKWWNKNKKGDWDEN